MKGFVSGTSWEACRRAARLAAALLALAALGCAGSGSSEAGPAEAGAIDAGSGGSACAGEGLARCESGCDPAAEVCVGPSPGSACCRLVCDPADAAACGAADECRPVSSLGMPTGASACVAVQEVGAQCAPELCRTGAACVGSDPGAASCREACDPAIMPDTCGDVAICIALAGGDPPGACLPVGDAGDPCAPEPCLPGSVCTGPAPDAAYCRQQCDPSAADPGCPDGSTCAALRESMAEGACLPDG